ncbi:MAG TPA: tetratricopeptide repeat protein [Deltaproteobacteria bacterium]|nr:tetratricopeptide repeat protein [Deltaproteobacteria bacterium]HQI82041.1 tetratricopeptide repeat protein [Deltaproteobacteria bacterium]
MTNTASYDSTATKAGKALTAVLILLVLFGVFMRYMTSIDDTDIWFQMAYGRYFLEFKTLIPDHSVFSWTPTDNSQIYCAWVAEIFLYLLYKAGGIPLLIAFRYACVGVFLLFVALHARRNGVLWHPFTWLVVFTGCLMSASGVLIKPEIFSLVLMTLTVWTWWQVKTSGENAHLYCYALPALLLVWVNSHGGVIFGMSFMGLLFAGEVANGLFSRNEMLPPKTRKHFFIAMGLCAAAVFITPYGWRYPVMLVHDFIIKNETQVREFRTVYAYQNIFYGPLRYLRMLEYLCGAVAVLAAFVWPKVRDRRIDWVLVLTNVFFCIVYINFVRTTYFWAIVFVFSAIALMPRFLEQPFTRRPLFTRSLAGMSAALVVFLVGMASYKSVSIPTFGFTNDYFSPVEESAFIKKHFRGMRLGNDYNTGGYLLWDLWPDTKVFLDARHFPYKAWYKDYLEFIYGQDRASKEAFVRKQGCDLWCLPLDFPQMQVFLASSDWQVVFYGRNACIFAASRLNFPATERLAGESVIGCNIFQAYPLLLFTNRIQDTDAAQDILENVRFFPFLSRQRKLFLEYNTKFGNHLAAQNDFSRAARIYQRSVELDPGNASLRVSLGNAYARVNSIGQAIPHLEEALRLEPGNAQARQVLDRAREQLGRIEMNIANLTPVVAQQPSNIKAVYTLAVLYSYAGQIDKAMSAFLRALALEPNNPELLYNIACLHARQGDADEAEEWLKKAVDSGFADWKLLRQDSDLGALSRTAFYRELLRKATGG